MFPVFPAECILIGLNKNKTKRKNNKITKKLLYILFSVNWTSSEVFIHLHIHNELNNNKMQVKTLNKIIKFMSKTIIKKNNKPNSRKRYADWLAGILSISLWKYNIILKIGANFYFIRLTIICSLGLYL